MKNAKKTQALFEVLRVLAALAIAYMLVLLCITAMVDSPLEGIKLFVLGPFSSLRRFGNLIARMIPYLLTGAGMCFCYAAGRYNLAGEGGVRLAGCITAYCAIAWEHLQLPHVVFVALLLLVGAVCGSVTTGFTAVLREKLGTNELVVSLMLNYVVLYGCNYLLNKVMRDASLSYTASQLIPESARLTTLLGGTTIHSGLIVGLVLVALSAVVFFLTPLGLYIRVCGSNPQFAKSAGVGMNLCLLAAQIIGGALAGIGGSLEILGIYDRFQWTALTQYGFDGLIVAVLAHKNPLFVPIGAFLLAHMRMGASILNVNSSLPIEFVQVMQAVLILLIAAETFLEKQKNTVIFKNAKKELQEDCAK